MSFLDGFILVSIGGLVLLEVVPHALHDAHYGALAFMAVGFVLPTVAERLLHLGVRQTHLAVLLLALGGLIVHSVLDGTALAAPAEQGTNLLGVGVVLHQLPVSLMIWWGFRDRPRWVPWAALALMAAMTVVGYVAQPTVFAELPHGSAAWFEALIGGSLLHVVAHPAHDHEDGPDHDHTHDHDHHGARGHDHGDDIKGISLSLDRPMNGVKFTAWLDKLLGEKGQDILRAKGIINVEGEDKRLVFQAVHMILEGDLQREWGTTERRWSRAVFIGRDLDEAAIRAGFESCAA